MEKTKSYADRRFSDQPCGMKRTFTCHFISSSNSESKLPHLLIRTGSPFPFMYALLLASLRYSGALALLCRTKNKGCGVVISHSSNIRKAVQTPLRNFSGIASTCRFLLFNSVKQSLISSSVSKNMMQSHIFSLDALSPFTIMRWGIFLKLREHDCSLHLPTIDPGNTLSMHCSRSSNFFNGIVLHPYLFNVQV